jgi:hypothetical protein
VRKDLKNIVFYFMHQILVMRKHRSIVLKDSCSLYIICRFCGLKDSTEIGNYQIKRLEHIMRFHVHVKK